MACQPHTCSDNSHKPVNQGSENSAEVLQSSEGSRLDTKINWTSFQTETPRRPQIRWPNMPTADRNVDGCFSWLLRTSVSGSGCCEHSSLDRVCVCVCVNSLCSIFSLHSSFFKVKLAIETFLLP